MENQTITTVPKNMVIARIASSACTLGDMFKFEQNDPTKAVIYYNIAAKQENDPSSKKYSLCHLAGISIDQKNLTKAEEYIEKAKKVTDTRAFADVELLGIQGYLAQTLKDLDKAKGFYKQALILSSNQEQTPLSSAFHYQIGMINNEQNNLKRARKHFILGLPTLHKEVSKWSLLSFKALCKLENISLENKEQSTSS